jgi:hypothetical protein
VLKSSVSVMLVHSKCIMVSMETGNAFILISVFAHVLESAVCMLSCLIRR